MKKKLLISAVLALVLVCLFAIAVGATTYNYSDEEGNLLYTATAELKANRYEMITTESGNLAKTDADGNSLTWYVINDDNGTSVRNITVKSIKTTDAGVITEGKFTFTGDVTANNVVSVNFFGMDVKTFGNQLFMTTANKTPSGSNSEYCQVANGKYLLFLYLPKSLTAIPENFCYRTSLRVLEFEDNTVLYNTVPQNAFQYMANLKSLTIPEGIETLQVYSFRECLSLAYLKFPSTMLRLEHNVFHRSIGFETVIFGENMTYIGYLNSDYTTVYNSWNIKNYNIKYMYVPNSVNTANSSFDTFRGKDNNYINVDRSLVFLFTGTLAEAKAVANCSADRHFKSAVNGVTSAKNSTTPGEAPVEYSVYIQNREYYDNLNKDRHVLVYNVPDCVAYGHKYASSVTSPDCVNDGYTTYTCTVCSDSYTDNVTEALGHTLSDATCTAPKTCSACGATDGEALGHNMSGWKVSEGNVIVNECSRCDYAETRTVEASVNGVFYETFAEAYANFADGAEVVLYVDLSFNSILVIDKSVTLDGNGKTISSTAGRAINVSGAVNVTIENLTVVCTGERGINVIQGAANVILDNVDVTAYNYAINFAGTAAGAKMTVTDSVLTGLNVVNVAAENAEVTIDNTTINCNDKTSSESYGAIYLNKDAINGKIIATNVQVNVMDDSLVAINAANGGCVMVNGSIENVSGIVAYIQHGDYHYAFTSFEKALNKAVAGETIVLLAPVTVTTDTTYDLTGITVETTGDAFIVTNGATLTLNGNGTVNAGISGVGSWVAVWADGGHAVINGGTYTVGGDSSTTDVNHQNDLIYTKNGGTVTIYGGTFVVGDGIWALNQNDKTGGAIVVYGGTFDGFDPANNVSEGPNTSFVAKGYHSVEANGTYTVEACEYTLTTITYADYAKAGVKVYTCASCGATTEEAADALIIALGYSASEAELGGITVGYKMNNKAIAEYEEATGVELTYGVFAAAASTIGNNDIFDANGALVDGVISKEASSLALDALNLKIVGFNTEVLMEAELVMGMYVNNGTSVSYVQAESSIDGKYHIVSYNKLTKEEE